MLSKTPEAAGGEYGVEPALLAAWHAEFLARATEVFAGDERERRIAGLERKLKRTTTELEVARTALELAKSMDEAGGTGDAPPRPGKRRRDR